MMLARVCRSTVSPGIITFLKAPVIPKSPNVTRLYANDAKTLFGRRVRAKPTLLERAMAPSSGSAIQVGKGFTAFASVVGLGALCFYGAGLSSQHGAIDYATLWPQYIKDRIQTTYMYYGGSLVVCTASAVACMRSKHLMTFLSRHPLMAFAASTVALIAVSTAAHKIPYQKGFGAKQMAWLLHSAIVGSLIAPLSFVAGTIIIRAAVYTAGIIGGLSTVAICAPSDKFLNMAGPLSVGLGVVFASSIASMFLPPTAALGSGFYAISLYGGLVLFSMFLLYDTQLIIKRAETQPLSYQRDPVGRVVTVDSFDPVNSAMSIYMDTINIFIRMVAILAGNGGKKK